MSLEKGNNGITLALENGVSVQWSLPLCQGHFHENYCYINKVFGGNDPHYKSENHIKSWVWRSLKPQRLGFRALGILGIFYSINHIWLCNNHGSYTAGCLTYIFIVTCVLSEKCFVLGWVKTS